jgi:hypothetical protein
VGLGRSLRPAERLRPDQSPFLRTLARTVTCQNTAASLRGAAKQTVGMSAGARRQRSRFVVSSSLDGAASTSERDCPRVPSFLRGMKQPSARRKAFARTHGRTVKRGRSSACKTVMDDPASQEPTMACRDRNNRLVLRGLCIRRVIDIIRTRRISSRWCSLTIGTNGLPIGR